jgi:hypothetical protein
MGQGRALLVGLAMVVSGVGVAEAIPSQFPGNGHFYDVITVPGGISWGGAKALAELLTLGPLSGHLATITSDAEGAFVTSTFDPQVPPSTINYWLGGFQPVPGLDEPAGGWVWVTGEPFIYTNWQGGEPNDAGDEEHALLLWEQINGAGARQWNDGNPSILAPGFVVEFERVSVPEPLASGLLLTGLTAAVISRLRVHRRR